MASSVSLVSNKLFDFAEMRDFSLFERYCHEDAQSMRGSASRDSAKYVQIVAKHFIVLRLLQNMPAKSSLSPPVLGGVKMTPTTLHHKSANDFTILVVDILSTTTLLH